MKSLRLLLLAVGGALLVLASVVAVVLSSSFQTWAVRRAIASRPGLHVTVGSVSAGLQRVRFGEVRIEHDGAVLALPALEIDLPLVSAGLNHRALVSRLVARNWTLDLSGTGRAPAGPAAGGAAPVPPAIVPAAAGAFAGVFARLQLPLEVSLDGVELDGELVLPERRGRTKVAVKGGGLGPGRTGTFAVATDAALADPGVSEVVIRGELSMAMDTPVTFGRITVKIAAEARGTQFPAGVKLGAEAVAERSGGAETYVLAVASDRKELVSLRASLPQGAPRLGGSWKIDLHDTDVAPFAHGKVLPAFSADGEGAFDCDVAFTAVHAAGRLNATADRLQVIAPELGVLGRLMISANFDLAGTGGAVAVQKMEATIDSTQRIATIRSLQAFGFDFNSGELRAADTARDLVGISLAGVPVAWAQPFLADIAMTGGHLRGVFTASPRGGGVTVRSTAPLTIDRVSVLHHGRRLLQEVDVAFDLAADYTPIGWQAEITAFSLGSDSTKWLSLDAKVGCLAGTDQPIKVTAKVSGDLPRILSQPVAAGAVALTGGRATIDFAGSLGGRQEFLAKISLQELSAMVDAKEMKLPALSADFRADIAAGGRTDFNAPILIDQSGRKTDFTLNGTIEPEKNGVRAFEASVSSTQFVVEDAQIFSAALPPRTKQATPAAAGASGASPPWAGLRGVVILAMKRVVYSEKFEVNDVSGRMKIEEGMLALESLQAGLGGKGQANLKGVVTFDAAVPQPYGMKVDVAVREFDPGPFFRSVNGGGPATVEGKFDVSSRLAARAENLDGLALGAGGEFQLTSKGGVFRGFPVNVTNVVESSGKLAGIIASAGNVIGGITGKKEAADIASKAQAVAEFSKGLNPIPYDQLSVVLTRDSALNTTLKDFALISPELRLTGSGTALHKPGTGFLEDSLAMEFKLRARGRQGDLLKYLGALEPHPDAFGYSGSTLPLKVGGSLGKPDTSEINGRLAALALEKGGVTDKAAELFNKVFGK